MNQNIESFVKQRMKDKFLSIFMERIEENSLMYAKL